MASRPLTIPRALAILAALCLTALGSAIAAAHWVQRTHPELANLPPHMIVEDPEEEPAVPDRRAPPAAPGPAAPTVPAPAPRPSPSPESPARPSRPPAAPAPAPEWL